MAKKPRAKTELEVRKQFIQLIHAYAKYWGSIDAKTPTERCEGMAFVLLNIFDGTTAELPAMNISLAPHESDKEYCIEEGQNWYEPNMVINNCMLHEEFYAPKSKKKK